MLRHRKPYGVAESQACVHLVQNGNAIDGTFKTRRSTARYLKPQPFEPFS